MYARIFRDIRRQKSINLKYICWWLDFTQQRIENILIKYMQMQKNMKLSNYKTDLYSSNFYFWVAVPDTILFFISLSIIVIPECRIN